MKNEIKEETMNLKKELDELYIRYEELQQEHNELCTQYNELRENYLATMRSFSWKITTPIHGMAPLVQRIIGKHRNLQLIAGGLLFLKQNGLKATIRRTKSYLGKSNNELSSDDFILDSNTISEQKNTVFQKMPCISILVPLYNTPERFLKEMIDSVLFQTYGNWQLCLADGSDEEHNNVEKICKKYMKSDARISYSHLEENKGISENTNACIQMVKGDYIALFDHDDLLTQDALFEVVKRINQKEDVDVIYTDEDKIIYEKNKKSRYVEPHCKSDFNLDLLRTNNYICHFFVVKKEIVDRVGGFRKEYDGSQDFDFIFRCVEKAKNVEHISKILYHWRIHSNSTAANPQSKMYCYEAGKKAIEAHLERMHVEAEVSMTEHLGFYRVKYPVHGEPLVSIIIPNKDEKETLETCINSILEKTVYSNYEIIVVENNSESEEIFSYYKELEENSKIRVVTWEQEFNYSKINNYGVDYAEGDYIVLLNNDVEVISEEWLTEMLANCQRKEVGIVGAKLLYPDNTVQHSGVIIGLGGIAGHAFVGADRNDPGYFGRAFVQQDLSAVTAACLMVSKAVFEEVGRLEEQLQVAFNDIDFCLKVREAGYLVVLNPNVLLYHYESKSRGAEDTPEKMRRFQREIKFMEQKWSDILENGDPYYNSNLSLIYGDFRLDR